MASRENFACELPGTTSCRPVTSRKTSAFALYVGSYLPLSLVLVVQDIPAASLALPFCRPADIIDVTCNLPLMHPWWSLGMVAVCALCLAATLITLKVVSTPRQIMVAEVKHVPADLVNYVVPYIVSFMGLDYGTPTKLLGFAVLFLWIFWITYRSGQIAMNPVLIVFGWRLFEIKYSYLQSSDAWVGRALCRAEVHPNRIYYQGSLQDVIVLREMEQGEADG